MKIPRQYSYANPINKLRYEAGLEALRHLEGQYILPQRTLTEHGWDRMEADALEEGMKTIMRRVAAGGANATKDEMIQLAESIGLKRKETA